MRCLFSTDEMSQMTLAEPFSFTKGCPTMKIPADYYWAKRDPVGTMLFDLEADPGQEHPFQDPEIEERMIKLLVKLMKENDAPAEQYERLLLPVKEYKTCCKTNANMLY